MAFKIYAQLNNDGVCTNILEFDNYIELNDKNKVGLQEVDLNLIKKRYKDGTWEEVDPMYFYHPLSEQETASLQMQSDLEYLVCLKELGL